MDFGMPVLLELDGLIGNIEHCARMGLDFVELNMNMPGFQLDDLVPRIGELRGYMKRYGMYFTFHMADDINIADFNRLAAEAHVKTVVLTMELARELGAPIINIHLNNGTYVTLPDERVYLFEKYNELFMDRIGDFKRACEGGSSDGLHVCIENCGGFPGFARRALDYLMESDTFGLTLDIGHDYCAGGVDAELYKKHIDKLWHMHLHDASPAGPHLALGRGEIDIKRMLEHARDRSCRMVIETKTVDSLTESIQFLNKVR